MLKFLAVATLFCYAGAISLPTSFVLIGDSTTAKDSAGGWGNGFCGSTDLQLQSVLEPGTPCHNTAKGGATTASFLKDGSWDISVARIKEEVAKHRRTIVTIQFGHNDEYRSTKEIMHQDLTNMVKDIRALGAEPVLVTALTRRDFGADGKIVDDLAPWANVTTNVAEVQKTHYIDLHGTSLKYCEAIGEAACHRLNAKPTDITHINPHGAVVFGRMVADLLNSNFGFVGINLLPIVPNWELSYNISHGIASY
ncbi:carbohydrate esterase family 12 protein [Moniliophthora roreri MCA 2997]|uniref:Carbohydrate esterase family 12 protein n=2 Tax=Moniliophthora roreri TaxID=221103 RepID=V2XPM0_MONRO|nr:carbohydrate esterase family 12 protein [Moniliophthora roreri MCA 2997]KAI3614282.1 carbohydrate esterase family 12 protein [Moniliophthora roreri]